VRIPGNLSGKVILDRKTGKLKGAGLHTRNGHRRHRTRANLSKRNPEHKVYPYLLRGLMIRRPNQVWGIDITGSNKKETVHGKNIIER
jgi:hypothetical protein